MHELRLGSLLHVGTIGASGLVVTLFCVLGRRLRDQRAEGRWRAAWAAGMAIMAAGAVTYLSLPARFDPRYTLPLHLCDLTLLLAAWMLVSERRWLRAVTYFWTLALSTQAFFTPVVRLGPAHVEFWLFWVYHVQIIGAAAYDISVRAFRPSGRDYLTACAATLAYGAVVIPINLYFDWNYGFLGRDEGLGRGTVLDHLPAWPWRPPVMFALAVLGMAILWGVWPAARWLRAGRGIGRAD